MPISKTGNYSDEKFDYRKRWVAYLKQQNRPVGDNIPNAVLESCVDEEQFFRMATVGLGGVPVRPHSDLASIVTEPWFKIKQGGSLGQNNSITITGPIDTTVDPETEGTALPVQSRARYLVMGLMACLDATVEWKDDALNTEPLIHSKLTGILNTGAVGQHKLSDTHADFTFGTDEDDLLVGRIVTDLTTGNAFTVTANDATTITVAETLAGDVAVAGDVYRVDIASAAFTQTDQVFLNISLEEVDRVSDSNIQYTVGGANLELERPIKVKQVIEYYQRSLFSAPPTLNPDAVQTYTDGVGNIHFRAKLATIARTGGDSAILDAAITDTRTQFIRSDIGNLSVGQNNAKQVLEGIWFADNPSETKPFLTGTAALQDALNEVEDDIDPGDQFLVGSQLMQTAVDLSDAGIVAGERVLLGDAGIQDAIDTASPDPSSTNPFAVVQGEKFILCPSYDVYAAWRGALSGPNPIVIFQNYPVPYPCQINVAKATYYGQGGGAVNTMTLALKNTTQATSITAAIPMNPGTNSTDHSFSGALSFAAGDVFQITMQISAGGSFSGGTTNFEKGVIMFIQFDRTAL